MCALQAGMCACPLPWHQLYRGLTAALAMVIVLQFHVRTSETSM